MDAHPARTDGSTCPGCAARDRRIAELEARIGQVEGQSKDLRQRMERLTGQLEGAHRSAKRQAAPFAKGPPKTDPKSPGRKRGDAYGPKAFRRVPPVIDEVYDAPLPEGCPQCGGPIAFSHTDHQYQVEMPRRPIHRQFNVAVGHCPCCRKRVQGRHPLQTSDALGCCASQIGPEAQAAVVILNKELGLSQGKISRFFDSFVGIKLSRGGSCQIMLRAAKRLEENYQAIVRGVQASRWIVPDETGWRIGGTSAWLHVAVGETAVAYRVDARRGFEASVRLIGEDYAGTLIHDGWSPYEKFDEAEHQTCLAHLLRRCGELLDTAVGGAVVFPRRVKALLHESLAVRDRRDAGTIQPATAARQATRLQAQMTRLIEPVKTHAANERLAAHLWNHRDQLFTFLRHPGVDATNWRAESRRAGTAAGGGQPQGLGREPNPRRGACAGGVDERAGHGPAGQGRGGRVPVDGAARVAGSPAAARVRRKQLVAAAPPARRHRHPAVAESGGRR